MLATFTVMNDHDHGPGSLRAAIHDANSTNGPDDIEFANVLGGKVIELASQLPPITESVSITGPGSKADSITIAIQPGVQDERPFFVESTANTATFSNLTITGGNVEGVIFLSGLPDGGGLWNDGPNTVLTNVKILDNSAAAGGGVFNSGTLTINDSTIDDNEGEQGGGIFNTGTLVISDSVMDGNIGEVAGGGIYNEGTSTIDLVTISNSNPEGSISVGPSGDNGGGIESSQGTLTVSNSTISGNAVVEDGGGIRVVGGTATITNTTITNNQADTGLFSTSSDGGGLYSKDTLLTISDSTISDNAAGNQGGGLRLFGTTATISNSTITGNSAGDDGGGMAVALSTVTIEDSTIASNSADAGGGIADQASGVALVTINSTTIDQNSSATGGGLAAFYGEYTISDSTISNNSALSSGGGIWTDTEGLAQVTVLRSTIRDNAAADGSGSGNGGGVLASGSVTITDSTLHGNSAHTGGGMAIADLGTLVLNNSTVHDNSSLFSGGGIGILKGGETIGSLTINNSTITANAAGLLAGGIDVSGDGTEVIYNSIIDENVVQGLIGTSPSDLRGSLEAGSHNWIGTSQGAALLGPLQDNGGPTLTRLPLSDSPVIDAGDNTLATDAGLTLDQRGLARIVDGDRDGLDTVDMGATEFGPRGEIQGQKFHDLNGNGVRDPGEPGLDGWTIQLFGLLGQFLREEVTTSIDLDEDGAIDPETEQGWYSFVDLNAGAFNLGEVQQAGWIQTVAPGLVSVTTDRVDGQDFGNSEFLANIRGQKFYDTNSNGVRDPGEPGLDGWTIQLFDEAGELLAEQVTENQDLNEDGVIDPETEQGWYEFTGLAPGTYAIDEILQPGWFQTLLPAPLIVTSTEAIEKADVGNVERVQIVSSQLDNIEVPVPTKATLQIPIQYNTSDENTHTTGLGVRTHFNSSLLSFTGITNRAPGTFHGAQVLDDVHDFDGDPTTDQFVLTSWTDDKGRWPSRALPARLLDADFTVSGAVTDTATTTINFTSSSTDVRYQFLGRPVHVELVPASLDIDGNGHVDALSDGLLGLRYLFGARGSALVEHALATGAQRSDPAEIATYLAYIEQTILDADGNGSADALTDAAIIQRYLFGYEGDALVDGVLAPDATRTNPSEIANFLAQFRPEPVPDHGPFDAITSPYQPWELSTFGTYTGKSGQDHPFQVVSHIPENAEGLVFFFHGTGGKASIVDRLEAVAILDELVDRGYGFIATDSQRRPENVSNDEPLRWFTEIDPNDPRSPDEYQRLRDLRDHFIATHSQLDDDTPILAMGFSNGGAKALAFAEDGRAQGWAVAAAAVLDSPIDPASSVHNARVPAFLQTLENDVLDTNRPASLTSYRETLLAEGIPAELYIGQEKLLTPERFNRIPAIAEAESDVGQAIVDILVEEGAIDSQGALIIDLAAANGLTTTLIHDTTPGKIFELLDQLHQSGVLASNPFQIRMEVARQIEVPWALHQISAEFKDDLANFFDDQLVEILAADAASAFGAEGEGIVGPRTSAASQHQVLTATPRRGKGSAVRLDVSYMTDPPKTATTGLGSRLHFDSSKLEFSALTDAADGLIVEQLQSDTEDLDGDPATDTFLLTGFFNVDGQWPVTRSANVTLASIDFVLKRDFHGPTTLNITPVSTAGGFELKAPSVTIGKPHTNPRNAWDVNDDGEITAIDALILLNRLNDTGAELLDGLNLGPHSLDVNNDGHLAPVDALAVINWLNDKDEKSNGASRS